MSRMTTRQRRRKQHACGAWCFGDATGPKAKRAGRPRYPICSHGCEPDCKSVHQAWKRAAQQHERKVKAKLRAIAKRLGCRWAEGR